MSEPTFHGKMPRASHIIAAIGDDLLRIKSEDKMTWAEVGEVLGKSEDQAAKYVSGDATMDIVSYTRARVEWNGRFTGSLDKLVQEASGEVNDHHALTALLTLCAEISEALEDGSIRAEEIVRARKKLENGRDVINKLLSRIGPRECANG